MANSKEILLKTTLAELSKTYVVYDGNNRVSIMYTAGTSTANGEPCIKTEYEYDGTSARVIKRKESEGTWNSSYDI